MGVGCKRGGADPKIELFKSERVKYYHELVIQRCVSERPALSTLEIPYPMAIEQIKWDENP